MLFAQTSLPNSHEKRLFLLQSVCRGESVNRESYANQESAKRGTEYSGQENTISRSHISQPPCDNADGKYFENGPIQP